MQGKAKSRAALIAFVILAGVTPLGECSPATGQSKAGMVAEEESRRQAIQAEVEARQALIVQELKQARPSWAGIYHEGGIGADIRMSMAPRNGVAALWQGCLGTYEANAGQVVEQRDGSLRLGFTHPNARGIGGFPDTVIPVKWGERRYLLAPPQLMDFVNAISNGEEPRADAQGRFLLAEGDEHKAVEGLPSLPQSYAGRFRPRPVGARITQVERIATKADGDFCEARYRLLLRVPDGKTLYRDEALNPPCGQGWAQVKVIESTSGAASASASVLGNCRDVDGVLAVGQVLTTGAYDPAGR